MRELREDRPRRQVPLPSPYTASYWTTEGSARGKRRGLAGWKQSEFCTILCEPEFNFAGSLSPQAPVLGGFTVPGGLCLHSHLLHSQGPGMAPGQQLPAGFPLPHAASLQQPQGWATRPASQPLSTPRGASLFLPPEEVQVCMCSC